MFFLTLNVTPMGRISNKKPLGKIESAASIRKLKEKRAPDNTKKSKKKHQPQVHVCGECNTKFTTMRKLVTHLQKKHQTTVNNSGDKINEWLEEKK
jgi:hypothetical protein